MAQIAHFALYSGHCFIQAANVILMRLQNWEQFRFGAWLKAAQPHLHRNKLATALANKLARIAWSVLRNNASFGAHRVEVVAILSLNHLRSSRCEQRHGTD